MFRRNISYFIKQFKCDRIRVMPAPFDFPPEGDETLLQRGILEQGDRFGDIAVVADRLVEVEHHAEVIFPAPAEKFADFPEYRFPPDARSGFQYNLVEAEPDMVNSP